MATLVNNVTINAPAEKVWSALTNLELLDRFDPGISKSEVLSDRRTGVGASRKCELRPKGWFKEKITEWQPQQSLAFELFECTLPVKSLRHRYTFTEDNGKTRVQQVMEYRLKMGMFGKLMDFIMVRKKWDDGIKSFFSGLKSFVENENDNPKN